MAASGEKSKPAVEGRKRRSGASNGSVIRNTTSVSELLERGATQEIMTRMKMVMVKT